MHLAAAPALPTLLLLGCGARGPPRVRMEAPSDAGRVFKLRIDLGGGTGGNLKFKPLLPDSDAVVVRYPVPFGLNVDRDARGVAVCTKDGPGGERAGDILRYTTAWSLGLPTEDGITGSVARHRRRGQTHPRCRTPRAQRASCDPRAPVLVRAASPAA